MKRKLQVFVSSTFSDLIAERQAAVTAILKAGHIPAGMELFTAGDKSQMKTIERWIDESDVYMLILGGRYGSIEPTTGVSYTELEYDYASQQGKSLFAVVLHQDAAEERVRAHGLAVMEQSNPQALKLFRDKVLQNISSFFKDEKDIKLCVHESLSDIAADSELKGWVRASEVPDVQALHEELERIRSDNARLLKELSRVESKPRSDRDTGRISELIEILRSINVSVPAAVSHSESAFETNLLHVLESNGENFATGVTNAYGVSDFESFLYHNVGPKLIIHGLAKNDSVAAVRWRRTVFTPLGTKLLAHLQVQGIKSKDRVSSAPPKFEGKGAAG